MDKRIHFLVRYVPITILALFVVGIFSYQEYEIQSLRKEVSTLSLQLTSSTLALAKTVSAFDATLRDLGKQTSGLSSTLSYTQENIDAVRSKVGGVEQAVGSISGTVSTLQKLSQVDQMLLKKYSKVYFLNENYIPAHLTLIPKSFTYNENRDERFLTEANTFLLSLLNQSKQDGITLYVKSAYRSFDEQKSLKSQYAVTYGKGTANTFSADQGYSEHQLGTTIDFTTTGLNGGLSGFDKTEAYTWLMNNAYRFGFVLSYPKGNAYYIYEPWHFRFVGVKLATYLHDRGLHFYDIDQKEIDQYLVSIFD